VRFDLRAIRRALTPFAQTRQVPQQDELGRGMTPVAGRSILLRKGVRPAFIGIGILGVIYLLASSYISARDDRSMDSKPVSTGSDQIAQVTETPPVVTPVVAHEPASPPPTTRNVGAPATTAAPPPIKPVEYVRMPAASGEIQFTVSEQPKPTAGPSGAPGSIPGRPSEDSGVTKVVFKPSTIVGGMASSGYDLTYKMLPQKIPCILDGALDTQYPGSITCHTAADVESPGHVPLLHKTDTLITGAYKNDSGGQGNRVFSFAGTAIDTRTGCAVDLNNSNFTDGNGITGIPGDVDHRYMEKFGGAFLMLGLETLASLGQTALSKQGQTSLNIGSGGEVGSLASQMLRQQSNLRDITTVPPGKLIMVDVDHQIDFSHCVRISTR